MEGLSTASPVIEREVKVARLSQETGVDIKYGEKTWRPVQSIIDLVQNHLDANTTVYEKSLLSTLGITQYNPDDKTQQELVAQLDKLKYSSDDDQSYANLQRAMQGKTPDRTLLKEQLDNIAFQLPRVRVKVVKGELSQLITYSQLKDLPSEWQVTGIRIDDIGSGFDYRLLGMIGASTKRESSGKRGGLGEGLKVSVTHLVRAGATVRVYSRNQDQQWIARPQVNEGSVVFEGRKKEDMDNDVTGSLTDINFASPAFKGETRAEIVAAIDSRIGEGLGKYILDFRGNQFIPTINTSTELNGLGVAGGRIYVKGLLVEENDRLLFSYNLGEKWAIAGRDRKTVQKEVLTRNIKSILESLNNTDQIGQLVAAVGNRRGFFETSVMDGNLNLTDAQKEQWKEAISRIHNFTLGKSLFVADNTSSSQRRWARERGYQVIPIPSVNFKAMELYQKIFGEGQQVFLYPDLGDIEQEQTFDSYSGEARLSSNWDLDVPVANPQLRETLNGLKADFGELLARNLVDQLKKGTLGISVDLERLLSVKFAQAKVLQKFEDRSPFDYDYIKNTIYVSKKALKGRFSDTVDLYVQFLKVASGTGVYDVVSQEIISHLAAQAVANLRPDVWTALKIEGKGQSKFEKPTTYPAEKQLNDNQWIQFFTLLQRLNLPNITEEDFQEVLQQARESEPPHSFEQNLLASFQLEQGGSIFYFNGKLFSLNLHSLQLKEINVDRRRSVFFDSFKPWVLDKRLLVSDKHPFPDSILSKMAIPPSRVQIQDSGLIQPRNYGFIGNDLSIESFPGFNKARRAYLLDSKEAKHSLEDKGDYYLPYELDKGQSMSINFTQADQEVHLILKRRGDRIFAKKVVEGSIESIPPGQLTDIFAEGGGDLEVFNNVIRIRPNNGWQITVDKNEFTLVSQYPEQNKGKDYISSNITLDYGGEVWRDPKRILLDAIQNHIDAQKGQQPDITYTVLGPDNAVVNVSKGELQEMGEEWKIIGVDIKDTGSGYTTPYLTLLGRSSKTDEDLGKFGEGLKLLAGSALRQGINVEFASRDWIAQPAFRPQTVKDYETGRERTFNMLGYNVKWLDQPAEGSQTRFRTTLPNEKVWAEWIDVLDPRKADALGQRGLDRFVLPKDREDPTNGVVSVLAFRPGIVYEKGLLIPGNPNKPMMFGYNVDETIVDTRERNTYNQKLLDSYITQFFRNLTDKDVMKAILQKAKEDPQTDYYEYQFLGTDTKTSEITKVLWRQAYHEVLGDDAVLSMRPELNRLYRVKQGAVRSVYQGGIEEAVVNEAHLERDNLQILPEALTGFLIGQVYDSRDFLKAFQSAEVELMPDDQQRLFTFIQDTNLALLTILESLDSSPERRKALHAVVGEEVLSVRKASLQRMTNQNIRIKNPAFPADGKVEDDNGEAIVYLNQKILSDPDMVRYAYIHEVSHFLSGQKDYVVDFQRFMMMIALSRPA